MFWATEGRQLKHHLVRWRSAPENHGPLAECRVFQLHASVQLDVGLHHHPQKEHKDDGWALCFPGE